LRQKLPVPFSSLSRHLFALTIPSVGHAFLLQAVPHQTVKSHTSINLRYYHHKKHCFFDELLKHQQRFFQYHAKRREREKVRFLRPMKIIRLLECCMEDCTSLNDHFACECFQELARSCRRKLEEMEERERKKKEKADKVATQSQSFSKVDSPQISTTRIP